LADKESGKLKFSKHFGYVSLFPIFFGILDKKSEIFKSVLDNVREGLDSEYGLRSLALNDKKYWKDDDKKYWDGAVWVEMNYLFMRGLKKYYSDAKEAIEFAEKILKPKIENHVCG